jgi:ornithine cyclodeaminase/alanine dehydrogenase-like protein (mu-crystallin family)
LSGLVVNRKFGPDVMGQLNPTSSFAEAVTPSFFNSAALLSYDAKVSIYDINPDNSRQFLSSIPGSDSDRITIEPDFQEALAGYSLVVDATNAAEIIHAEDISPQTFIAAPGMPLGLSRDALNIVSDRLLHDSLQIGVATMGVEIVKQLTQNKNLIRSWQ